MREAMHKVLQCISKRLLEVNHKPEVNHKWNGSVNIAGRKHNWYTGKEDILNGGNKQCLMLYEQDMNEEAYRDRSGMDLWIGSDQIWHPELQMRSANVWDMTVRQFGPHWLAFYYEMVFVPTIMWARGCFQSVVSGMRTFKLVFPELS